ncbi:MAG: hypothetical protein IJ544_01720 [Prevotella sp.]|nr:hypothetical protein [Prevotella sp.]
MLKWLIIFPIVLIVSFVIGLMAPERPKKSSGNFKKRWKKFDRWLFGDCRCRNCPYGSDDQCSALIG